MKWPRESGFEEGMEEEEMVVEKKVL